MNCFEREIAREGREGLFADRIDVIQVNVGLRCNQSCAHCHLSAGPECSQVMDSATMEKVVTLAGQSRPAMVDITGGAPELNPNLSHFITALDQEGLRIQVRTNLTALLEPSSEGLMEVFKARRVKLVGSFPCYLEENVRAQRGQGVYESSVEVIRRLNRLGYGVEDGLDLNLVYNPGGAYLPGDQGLLEADYRRELRARFGIAFSGLFTIANMPIGRFSDMLFGKERHERYMKLLMDSHNPDTLPGLMCRSQVSIGWDGTLYDCDFNLALGLSMNHGAPDHIDRWDPESVKTRRIVTGDHCFGCTAGCGSSFGGALAER
ncbi:MAG: arsenosugar biosynthesis radical SAM protein ArsS [Proteobacteria bacterium]|nr:arsenosugar biosynthesis radical SAM protein ArsS [Pseudomonadota bacterium]